MASRKYFRGLPLAAQVVACLLIISVWLISAFWRGHSSPVGVRQPVATGGEIKVVTPADYAAELDNASNVLIQVCKPGQCKADKDVLARVRQGFAQVKFVQMSSKDNVDFAERLEREQAELAKINKTAIGLQYPVYVFKGNDLNVAPPLRTDDEVKQFIATNVAANVP